jgi:hypothetical protein
MSKIAIIIHEHTSMRLNGHTGHSSVPGCCEQGNESPENILGEENPRRFGCDGSRC